MDIRFKSGFAFTLMAAVAVAAACGQPVASQQGIGPARIPTPHTQVVRVPTTQATGAEANFTVVYRDGVFEPGRLDIKEGETVRFVNESGVEVWPASHIHPTHQIYPEFDPGAAIPPGGSWEFTFDQSGYWRYHNHVEASETGLVVVLGTGGSSGEAIAIKNESPTFQALGIVSLQDAINLFRDDVLLATYIERYGPDVTIRVLSENERVVGGDCHQRAHSVGRIAYEKFGALAFSLSGHECHSGGYHGAMEALFRERGTVNLEADISAVCGGGLNTFFRHQCVHGVGHGLMAWTSYELFDSLKLCDILDTTNDKTSCYTGVFMENVVGGLAGSMGHTTDYLSEDPHYPCDVLDPEYVPYCYYYQTSRMVQLFDADFARVAQACGEAPEGSRLYCFQSMGRDIGGFTRGHPADAIRDCSYVTDPAFRRDCLEGAVQDSFWETGTADVALSFCGMLSDDAEAARCYDTIIGRARQLYATPEGLNGFCARVPERFRRGCP